MDIVVVGSGMAGTRLVQQLAPYGPGPGGDAGPGADAPRVTVIGEEAHAPYNRVLLAEVLAGRYAPGVITLPGAARRGRPRRAVRLDRAEQSVVCDDGSAVRYDRLVLATGSNPVRPLLRGLFAQGAAELPSGVHAFRTMDDCLALAAAAQPGVRVVVVGGGLMGVAAAQALAARGARVVVAHQGEYLMERHLDEEAGRLLRGHLESQGIEVHTECRARGLHSQPQPDGGRTVRSVELADGYCLGAELVVLACGVRPRVGLATAAGLDVARGVVVDDELRTSDPAIHAIGDCAQHAGTVYGLADAARQQADVLARVLTGKPAASYRGTRVPARLTLGGADRATAAGDASRSLGPAGSGGPVPAAGDGGLRPADADAARAAARRVVVRGDRLVGGILLGDPAAVGTVTGAWEGVEPPPSAAPLHLLTDDGGF